MEPMECSSQFVVVSCCHAGVLHVCIRWHKRLQHGCGSAFVCVCVCCTAVLFGAGGAQAKGRRGGEASKGRGGIEEETGENGPNASSLASSASHMSRFLRVICRVDHVSHCWLTQW